MAVAEWAGQSQPLNAHGHLVPDFDLISVPEID